MVGRMVMAVLCTAFGCGTERAAEPSASELCDDIAEAECGRIYDCLSPDEREAAGFPDDGGEACVMGLRANLRCAAPTDEEICQDASEHFDPERAASCADQTSGASCGQFRSLPNYAPACDQVCTSDG